jgi:hypothetical protein
MISFTWAAFWIALAAVIVSGRWLKARREALKYDTLVRLAEKTGHIDEGLLKILCPPQTPLPPHWFAPPPARDGRRVLRVFGTILMSIAAGLGVLFVALQGFFSVEAVHQASIGALGTAILLGFLGAGLYVAARFASPRRDDREAP